MSYTTGLIWAFLAFGGASVVAVVPLALLRGRSDFIPHVVTVWVVYGVPTLTVLAAIVGPVTLGLRRAFPGRTSVALSAVLGALLGPVLLLAGWLLFRESNETLQGLLEFWVRVPGEFLIGVVPHAAASAVFVAWLVSRPVRARPKAVQAARG